MPVVKPGKRDFDCLRLVTTDRQLKYAMKSLDNSIATSSTPINTAQRSTLSSLLSLYCSSVIPIDHMSNSRRRATDLNRPLPKLPSEKNGNQDQTPATPTRSSSSKNILTTSLIERLNSELSEIPMWSTSRLSKQQFDELSRDFELPSTPLRSFRQREAFNGLDPVKFSPSNTHNNSSMLEGSAMFLRYAVLLTAVTALAPLNSLQ